LQFEVKSNTNPPLPVHSPTHYAAQTAMSFISCRFSFNTVVMKTSYLRDIDKDGRL